MVGFLNKSATLLCLLAALASFAMAQSTGMMGTGTSMPTMPGYQGNELAENMVVPQFAVGNDYTTSIVLVNMGNMVQMPWLTPQALQVTGEIYFYNPDGTPLPVSVNGSTPVSIYAFTLSASNFISLEMTKSGDTVSGWALIKVDDDGTKPWGMMSGQQMMRANRIMATVDYNYKLGDRLVSRSGLIPSIYQLQHYFTSLVPVRMQEGVSTAMAIVNASAQPVTLQLTLCNADGEAIAIRQQMVPAGNQIVAFIDQAQFFEGMFTRPFNGFVKVDTSSEGAVTMGLLETGEIMTTITTEHYGPVSMMGM
jgi:hypothetical protein